MHCAGRGRKADDSMGDSAARKPSVQGCLPATDCRFYKNCIASSGKGHGMACASHQTTMPEHAVCTGPSLQQAAHHIKLGGRMQEGALKLLHIDRQPQVHQHLRRQAGQSRNFSATRADSSALHGCMLAHTHSCRADVEGCTGRLCIGTQLCFERHAADGPKSA